MTQGCSDLIDLLQQVYERIRAIRQEACFP